LAINSPLKTKSVSLYPAVSPYSILTTVYRSSPGSLFKAIFVGGKASSFKEDTLKSNIIFVLLIVVGTHRPEAF
jgi:hypothetical protein